MLQRSWRSRLALAVVTAIGLSSVAAPSHLLPLTFAPAGAARPAYAMSGPTLTSPPAGDTLPSFGPTLTWTNPPGVTQVHLQVSPANGDGPGLDVYLGSAATSYAVLAPPQWYGLLPGMSYTWRVRVSGTPGAVPLSDSSWSPWAEQRFRTPVVTAGIIEAMAPANGANASSLTPVIQWSSSRPDIYYYELQLSKDPAFTTDPAAAVAMVYEALLHGGVTNPPNSYTVPKEFPLEANTVYFWRVRPRVQGDGAPVAWPAAFRFSTEQGGGAKVMAVVDQPGNANEFSELTGAVQAACGAAGGGAARVEVRTARALSAGALTVGCDLTVQATQGQGQISGGMTVDAPGAFSLINFGVSGPAVFNVNRRIELVQNSFGSSAKVNIGAVGGAPFPAGQQPRLAGLVSGRVLPVGGSASAAGGATISDNQGTALDLAFQANVQQAFAFDVTGNRLDTLTLHSDTALFLAGSLNLQANPTRNINLQLQVGGSAECNIKNHSSVNRLTQDYTVVNGTFTCTEMANAGLGVNYRVSGDGRLVLRASGSQYERVEGAFSVRDVQIESHDNHYKGGAQLGFQKGFTTVSATISGSTEENMIIGAGLAGQFAVREGPGGPQAAVRPLAAASQRIVIENLRLTPRTTPSIQPRLQVLGFDTVNASEVVIRNNHITSDSFIALAVSEVGVPTTIEDNTMTGGGIYLYGQVDSGGTGAAPPATPYALRNNTVRPAIQAATGLHVTDLLAVTATGNTIQTAPFPAMDGTQAITLQRNAYVRFDGGNTITGNASLGAGAYARFQGNTFSGAYLNDLEFGGLVTNPLATNSGLDPDRNISTKVDFDGNDCADYPAVLNQKIDGRCVMEGVSPRTPPAP